MKNACFRTLATLALTLTSAGLWAGGELDTSFHSDGKRTVDFSGGDDYGYSIIQQSDGKLLVAGERYLPSSNTSDFAIARFKADGNPDTNFNGTGKRTVDFGDNEFANSAIQQADGKLVIAGTSVNNSGVGDIALVRLTNSGALDTTFSADGKLLINLGTDETANAVIQQSNGKLVVVGTSGGDGSGNIFVVRLNANGSLDTTFAGDGVATLDFGQDDHGYDIIQQSDGKLVLCGATGNATTGAYNIVVLRLTSAGVADSGFDADGVRVINVDDNDSGESIIQLGNGKLVVVGNTVDLATNKVDAVAIRLNADGSSDTLFDGDGVARIDLSGADNYGYSVIQQSDSKLVLAGKVNNSSGVGNLAIVRLKTNGALDTTFNATGKRIVDFGGNDYGWGMIRQSDGKLAVLGGTTKGVNASNDMAILRLLP